MIENHAKHQHSKYLRETGSTHVCGSRIDGKKTWQLYASLKTFKKT
jgi:hypothetical protein